MTYVQGAVIPVKTTDKEAYLNAIKLISSIFRENGALSTMDAWGVDVPDGATTDFKKAVMATADETVVFSWMVWPDKATADAASMKMRSDPRMNEWPARSNPAGDALLVATARDRRKASVARLVDINPSRRDDW